MANSINDNLASSSILLVTHSRATGFSQQLRNWLQARVSSLAYVDHPLHPKSTTSSYVTQYVNGEQIKKHYVRSLCSIKPIEYLIDFFFTLRIGWKTSHPYDIGIGVNCYNTLSLLVLRALKKVKRVIFHTVDYTPIRYENRFINWLYHTIDAICCYNVDCIWNSSIRMNKARIEKGMLQEKLSPTIITPDGSNIGQRIKLKIVPKNRKTIVYLGKLQEGMGIELLMEAFLDLRKKIPESKLILIGDGPLRNICEQFIKNYSLESSVRMTGFLPNHSDVDAILCESAIGVAMYKPDKHSYKKYSDVSKPKTYLSAGLPTVMTDVPEISATIRDYNAGRVIPYQKQALVDTLEKLFVDNSSYRVVRKNAIALSGRYSWNTVFKKAFRETFQLFTSHEDDKHLSNVKKFFDIRAIHHQSKNLLHHSRSSYFEIQKIVKLLNLKKNASIVELGAGYGRFVLPLLQKGYAVTAIDISLKSLNKIYSQAHIYRLTNKLKLLKTDGRKPFGNNLYDAALCISTFHLLAKKQETRIAIFRNLIRTVKPGGKVLLVEPNPYHVLYYPFYFFAKEVTWDVEKGFMKSTASNLLRIFQDLGLRNINVSYVGFIPLRFMNTYPWVEKLNAILTRIPIVKHFSSFIYIVGQR